MWSFTGLEPPGSLLVHSHWTVDGEKMSKSKFNVIDPMERAGTYTHDGMRYFLLREGTAHSDASKFNEMCAGTTGILVDIALT